MMKMKTNSNAMEYLAYNVRMQNQMANMTRIHLKITIVTVIMTDTIKRTQTKLESNPDH